MPLAEKLIAEFEFEDREKQEVVDLMEPQTASKGPTIRGFSLDHLALACLVLGTVLAVWDQGETNITSFALLCLLGTLFYLPQRIFKLIAVPMRRKKLLKADNYLKLYMNGVRIFGEPRNWVFSRQLITDALEKASVSTGKDRTWFLISYSYMGARGLGLTKPQRKQGEYRLAIPRGQEEKATRAAQELNRLCEQARAKNPDTENKKPGREKT
ncbi:cell division protein ZapA [Dethiosulfatarculus sandiegensis]|uniref:Uncharacterized protein n=1 Tax=Dethiosulfatarculus sandiegensis TaxID=1429043 RepID=A0A0D2J9G7_9BACT|nr:cell division protein ZapA [Dethiosulfatarculus sandiegensis]KIX14789.1 hypothetical protein X474_06500 [Dethiosulfatarculus sandiegensis]